MDIKVLYPQPGQDRPAASLNTGSPGFGNPDDGDWGVGLCSGVPSTSKASLFPITPHFQQLSEGEDLGCHPREKESKRGLPFLSKGNVLVQVVEEIDTKAE